MRVKYFYKKDCPKCPAAKEVLSKFNQVDQEHLDLDTVEGLAEGAYYSVFSTPSIIIVDEEGNEVYSWRGEVPSVSSLENILKKSTLRIPT
jgi:thioredoxin-related protein